MKFVDTHAHLADESFAENLTAIIERARRIGVEKMICVGTTRESSRNAIEIAERFPDIVYPTVGIHPNHAHEASDEDWATIVDWSQRFPVVALGETGLDRHWKDCPWPVQVENFHRHWSQSRVTGLPVIVHSRDCDDEMVEQLDTAANGGELRGVMHAFSGSMAMASRCLELGLYISFAGMVTYKKSQELRSVAESIPLERLLIETDSPYLSPEPKRGVRPNEPAFVVHTAECLARTRGLSLNEISQITTDNAHRLFGLTHRNGFDSGSMC